MASSSRCALFFFFLEVAVAIALLLPSGHARVCPPCGSTEVPYPLSTADGCGDPDYKISRIARARETVADPTTRLSLLEAWSSVQVFLFGVDKIKLWSLTWRIVCGLGGALVVAAAGLFAYRRQQRIRQARERLAKEREEILNANNSSGRTAKNFSGRELRRATANFSRDNLLGAGGYGEVYRGVLADGTVVAVKCAKLGNTKSTDQVLNEVRVLSQVNHRSLVRLLGCCVDLEQPLMVYEFIPNGTLADHLHGALSRPPLPWRQRLAIAHQTAEGIAYLHSSAVPPIYHRDIKSSNILLDERLRGKVSDFGLSRLAEQGLSHVSTCAQGTLGYLDPEYYRNYQLTDKSDVYSFGVVLLELLTSQRAIDFGRGADDVNLAGHVQRAADEERLMDVVDQALQGGATRLERDTMKALGLLALGCLEERRQNRPSMKEVAEEIEYIMNIEAGNAGLKDLES
uniref:Protein kinase domain-containing protein n=1 Tax=Oryza brachyantha TaxID=4533 RepID=J3MKQ8_ORYBR